MAKITDGEILNLVADRLEAIEGGKVGAELKRERELLQRERNLSNSERAASSAEAAVLAEKLNAARSDYDERITLLEGRFAELNEQLNTRQKSIRSGELLLQTKLSEMQLEIASAKAELAEVSADRLAIRENLAPLQGEITNMRDFLNSSNRPLRELAFEAVQSADKTDLDSRVAESVERAIRRGIDAGLLAPGPALTPAELQPKPQRPSVGD